MEAKTEWQKEIVADNLLRQAGVLGVAKGCMCQAYADARFYARHTITDIPIDTFANASLGRSRSELALELLNTLSLSEEDRWPLYYLMHGETPDQVRHFLCWDERRWRLYFNRLQRRYGSEWEGWIAVYFEEIRRRIHHHSAPVTTESG